LRILLGKTNVHKKDHLFEWPFLLAGGGLAVCGLQHLSISFFDIVSKFEIILNG
jgi:hypothetical protein